ncbi:Uncharacterised protein [Chlamydia trachomatis]|nr:Uncharacterised protein [Chlamydia trachomatis]
MYLLLSVIGTPWDSRLVPLFKAYGAQKLTSSSLALRKHLFAIVGLCVLCVKYCQDNLRKKDAGARREWRDLEILAFRNGLLSARLDSGGAEL